MIHHKDKKYSKIQTNGKPKKYKKNFYFKNNIHNDSGSLCLKKFLTNENKVLKTNRKNFLYDKDIFVKNLKNEINFKKANVLIGKINRTFSLDLLRVLKPIIKCNNKNNLSKGSVIEVKATILGLTSKTGLLITRIPARITNEPFLDGCINAVSIND
nr:putative ribosome biosis protein NSA2 [Cryptomonas sp.]